MSTTSAEAAVQQVFLLTNRRVVGQEMASLESGFSLQISIKTPMRNSQSEAKVKNLMTLISASIPLGRFDYAQAGAHFRSM